MITASAMAETTKVLSCPIGRSSSSNRIRKIEPRTAPRMVRRPPNTAAMMIWTVIARLTTVSTEAMPS